MADEKYFYCHRLGMRRLCVATSMCNEENVINSVRLLLELVLCHLLFFNLLPACFID